MTLVTPAQVSPNDEISDASVNTPINQIAAVVNGQLDDSNISAVSGSKIADGTVTGSKLADEAVTPEKRSGGFWGGKITITSTGLYSITDPLLDFKPKFVLFSSTRTQNSVHFSSGFAFDTGSSIVQGCASLGISFGVMSNKALFHHVDGAARLEGEVTSMAEGQIDISVTSLNHSSYGEWLVQAFG